jgi:hypothetical protein
MGCLAGFEHPGQGASRLLGGRMFSVSCRRNFLDRRPFAVAINERSLSRRSPQGRAAVSFAPTARQVGAQSVASAKADHQREDDQSECHKGQRSATARTEFSGPET